MNAVRAPIVADSRAPHVRAPYVTAVAAVAAAAVLSHAPAIVEHVPQRVASTASIRISATANTAKDTYSKAFHLALSKLTEAGCSPELAGHVLQTWHMLCAVADPAEPIVERTKDGGVRFAWNTARAYLDAEIYADGSKEWFFKDRETGKTDGTEDEREMDLPAAFFAYMQIVTG